MSLSNSMYLPPIAGSVSHAMPVMLPPGRPTLAMKPCSTGSTPIVITDGLARGRAGLDGEAVAGDRHEGIQAVFAERGKPGGDMAFDLLDLESRRVLREPRHARRKRLEDVLARSTSRHSWGTPRSR